MNDHKEPSKEEILKRYLSGLKDSEICYSFGLLAMEEFADAKVAIKTKDLQKENDKLKQSNAKLIEALEAVVNFHPAHGIDVLKEYINKVLKENKFK